MNSPNHENIDHWLFERLEGNLSHEQEQALSLFLLLNPEYDIDSDVWEKTKVNFPEIDPVMVSEMGFGVKQAEEKRNRRPHAFWLLSSAATITFLVTLYLLSPPPKQVHINSIDFGFSKAGHSRSLITGGIKRNKPSNFSYALFANKNKANALMNSKIQAIQNRDNNLWNKITLNGVELSQNNSFPIEASFSYPVIQDIPVKPINQNSETSLAGDDRNEHFTDNDSKSFKINLPFSHLSKSSALSKYLRKEVIHSTQKDRIYYVQEKSHLDISDAFAGNRSQTRFQSSTITRWIGTADQKLSQQLSIDGYARNLKSGFGIVSNYIDFSQGAIKEWNVRFIYSPKIALGKYFTIEPALSYVVGQKSIEQAKISNHSVFEYNTNQIQQFNYDQNQPLGDHLYYRDLNANIVVNTGPFYSGLNVQNLLKHQDNVHTNQFDTIQRTQQNTTFFIGTDFSAKQGDIVFSPMFTKTLNQSSPCNQIGATLQLKGMVIGGNYMSKNAFGALLGYQSENFSIIAQSLKTKPYTAIQPSYIHQLTIRINTNISRKTRRYLYL